MFSKMILSALTRRSSQMPGLLWKMRRLGFSCSTGRCKAVCMAFEERVAIFWRSTYRGTWTFAVSERAGSPCKRTKRGWFVIFYPEKITPPPPPIILLFEKQAVSFLSLSLSLSLLLLLLLLLLLPLLCSGDLKIRNHFWFSAQYGSSSYCYPAIDIGPIVILLTILLKFLKKTFSTFWH